jgi:hypothetical protein
MIISENGTLVSCRSFCYPGGGGHNKAILA